MSDDIGTVIPLYLDKKSAKKRDECNDWFLWNLTVIVKPLLRVRINYLKVENQEKGTKRKV